MHKSFTILTQTSLNQIHIFFQLHRKRNRKPAMVSDPLYNTYCSVRLHHDGTVEENRSHKLIDTLYVDDTQCRIKYIAMVYMKRICDDIILIYMPPIRSRISDNVFPILPQKVAVYLRRARMDEEIGPGKCEIFNVLILYVSA